MRGKYGDNKKFLRNYRRYIFVDVDKDGKCSGG